MEKGVDQMKLDPNRRDLLERMDIWLATCVGASTSEASVRKNLSGTKMKFAGVRFGANVSAQARSARLSPSFEKFVRSVGIECIRHCRGFKKVTAECQKNALGYGNMKGLTVTVWNVPTSTYTALWAPGVVAGEPWCPLFVRRGYVQNLVVG
jgi:hypothetical protein